MRIKHDSSKCVGCGVCVALCPANWELVGGVARPKKTEIDEEEYECNKKAADGCPVQCIEIEK